MTKKLSMLAISLLLVFGAFAPVLALSTQSASAQGGIMGGLDEGSRRTDPDADDLDDAQDRVYGIIQTVINVFSIVVGVISVIMIIIGGLKYITSGGDSGNVTGAKNTILYAIIGLVVVALSQVIVRFVIEQIGGQ